MKRLGLRCVSITLCLANSFTTAFATPASDAIKLYQQHSYKSAADAFESLFKKEKPTADNLYYAALSNRMCGQAARARQLFEYIVSNFPDSQSARYATDALKGAHSSGEPANAILHESSQESFHESFAANHEMLSSAKTMPPGVTPASSAPRTKQPPERTVVAAKFATMFYESKSPSARKVLFIGNSLTFVNQLPIVLAALAINSKTVSELRIGEVVEGGATLEHMFNQTNAVKAIAEDGPWTDVVLQDQSETPVKNPALTLEWCSRFVKEIDRAHARTIIFETWSLNGHQNLQSQYHDVYMQAARGASGLFVPAGDAFAMCHSEHPEIELYGDDRHPSQQGTYLAACVFYKKIFNKTPVGLPGDLSLAGVKVMNISANVASILQNIALKAGSN